MPEALRAVTPPPLPQIPCSGTTNRFEFDNTPGEFLTAGNVFSQSAYPVPACTAPGVKPVLTINFKGPAYFDGKRWLCSAAYPRKSCYCLLCSCQLGPARSCKATLLQAAC